MCDADICRKDSKGDDLAKLRHIVEQASVNGSSIMSMTGKGREVDAGQSKWLIDRLLANEMHVGLSVVHRRLY